MSVTKDETEIALYAKIEDPESLQEADLIEEHIQLESTLISGARMRVRKITPVKGGPEGGADRYEVTLKVPVEDSAGVPSSQETTQETDRGFFEAFANVAHRAVVKRRHIFVGRSPDITGAEGIVIPPVKYEVDLFINPHTREKTNWIKMDIELDEVIAALKEAGIDTTGVRQKFNINNLPFTSMDMFTPQTATPEQKALLSELWSKQFSIKLAPDVYVKSTSSDGVTK